MVDVSVIIPIHCRTEESLVWLKECLDSVKYQKCEVVAYNDGSSVDITSITKKCRVDTLRHGERNLGVSSARNIAARLATTDLLLPLDCDDRLVPDAIEKLLAAWDGVPVYPDVRKFGTENVPHYPLLDFHCDHIYNHVGFSSVNVLHSKDQWRFIRGWDTTLEFFEDGEYNARLFSQYCGVRLPEPLVEYRQHDNQRTKKYRKQSSDYARIILARIRRLNMACSGCGKRRSKIDNTGPLPNKAGVNTPMSSIQAPKVDPASLPGEVEGRVLVMYIGGKGKGKHYYQGPSTKFAYKVTHGDYLYVDPSDSRSPDNPAHPSLLVREIREAKPVAVAEPKKEPEKPKTSRKPRKSKERTPLVRASSPDITNMTVKKAIKVLSETDLTDEEIGALVKVEKANKNRTSLLEYLKSLV